MNLTKKLIFLGLLGLNVTSCVDLQEAANEAAAEAGAQGGQEFAEAQEGYDWDYASNMNNNFSNYDMQEGNNCFHMQQGGMQQQLPMHKPRHHIQTFGQNQYGMAVDGSQIRYNQGQSQMWQFQTPPSYLIAQRGHGAMIGMHRNGAPIYGYYESPYEQAPQTDQYGGRYGATEDFPNGIYHYVITINID
jgi:hypothetical protein